MRSALGVQSSAPSLTSFMKLLRSLSFSRHRTARYRDVGPPGEDQYDGTHETPGRQKIKRHRVAHAFIEQVAGDLRSDRRERGVDRDGEPGKRRKRPSAVVIAQHRHEAHQPTAKANPQAGRE